MELKLFLTIPLTIVICLTPFFFVVLPDDLPEVQYIFGSLICAILIIAGGKDYRVKALIITAVNVLAFSALYGLMELKYRPGDHPVRIESRKILVQKEKILSYDLSRKAKRSRQNTFYIGIYDSENTKLAFRSKRILPDGRYELFNITRTPILVRDVKKGESAYYETLEHQERIVRDAYPDIYFRLTRANKYGSWKVKDVTDEIHVPKGTIQISCPNEC